MLLKTHQFSRGVAVQVDHLSRYLLEQTSGVIGIIGLGNVPKNVQRSNVWIEMREMQKNPILTLTKNLPGSHKFHFYFF